MTELLYSVYSGRPSCCTALLTARTPADQESVRGFCATLINARADDLRIAVRHEDHSANDSCGVWALKEGSWDKCELWERTLNIIILLFPEWVKLLRALVLRRTSSQ
jgi:hypothetical protein